MGSFFKKPRKIRASAKKKPRIYRKKTEEKPHLSDKKYLSTFLHKTSSYKSRTWNKSTFSSVTRFGNLLHFG